MNHRILENLQEKYTLSEKSAIIVALSGGADSVCLLHLLWKSEEELGLPVMACHLNHGIRGDEAQRDENFVRSLCKEWNIPLFVRNVDVPARADERGVSLELCGRQERYRFFEELAMEYNAWVATAHTLSDSIETTLFHLARGTGLKGMCGIPERRRYLLRPLLSCTRQQIEEYCREQELSYVTDSTNLSDDYTRNYIRHHLIPDFEKVHPGFLKTFGETQRLLRQDEEFLEAMAAKAMESSEVSGGYDATALANLPAALRGRVLQFILDKKGISCSRQQICLMEQCLKDGGAVELTRGIRFRVRGKRAEVEKETSPIQAVKIPIREGIFPFAGGKNLRLEIISQQKWQNLKKFHQKVLKNTLDYDRINLTAYIRTRAPGDRVKLQGRGITKTVKKLFSEAGIPVRDRDTIPVLADEDKVLWIYGFGCDSSVAVGEKSQRILYFALEE